MSASALQPHASIRVPTASATSGGPLDVATRGFIGSDQNSTHPLL